MKKRSRMICACLVGALIVGVVGGVTYCNHRFHQSNLNRLDSDLSAFANILAKAQTDMERSTPNPTTPQEKAYEVNVKVDVGQLNVLWTGMYPDLIAQGLSARDVQQVEEGLLIVDTNILPPGATMDKPASVQRARAWITFFYDAMYPDNKPPKSNTDYFSRLTSRLSFIATKYRSYKSDPNFMVQ